MLDRMLGRWIPLGIIVMVVACGLGGLVGCKKVKDADKQLLALASLTAKERATSFAAMAPYLQAKDSASPAVLKEYLDAHGAGLNADAVAFADILTAVQAHNSLSEQTRAQLIATAETAKARSENWEAAVPLLNLSTEQQAWANTHLQALQAQAAKLSELATSLSTK